MSRKVRFVGNFSNDNNVYVFEEDKTEFLLDQNKIDVVGVNPHFFDSMCGAEKILIDFKEINGKNYISKIISYK